MYMRQFKHRAIINDDLIAELVNKKIIKLNRDGRTDMISFVANSAIKDMLKKKRSPKLW
jgi:hypothetical protein